MPQRQVVAWFLLLLVVASGDLCETCNGRGICNPTTRLCQCALGYSGPRCELVACPSGVAWADLAIATNTAHQMAVCSNMGICNEATGVCTCNAGFEGPACEFMSCPSCTNGRCLSMREAAQSQDDYNLFTTTTYSLWDADKIRGCKCDFGFTGYDCSQRTCPTGDDPLTTGQVPEVQQLSCLCNGCTGSFVLSYQGFNTINLPPTATVSALQNAINDLIPIHGVTVSLSGAGSTICDSDGAVSSITFTHNGGNVPSLRLTSLLTGGTSAISIQSSGATGLYDGVGTTNDGTTESAVCSNHGLCDSSTGLCTCQPGFSSSDGAGSSGTIPDCGYGPAPTTCPVTNPGGLVCNNHGTCNAGTSYKCICAAGYTGVDCSQRTCPSGIAWFDGATATDTAHAMAVCSNKGICNKALGTCTCQAGYSGSACELMTCPGTNGNCNGQGTCMTMQSLAQMATVNGVVQGYTYGSPSTPSTWDANKIQGCYCNQNAYFGPYAATWTKYIGYDCSTRACLRGSDPYESGEVDEVQSITCLGDGGWFTLTFRQYTTSKIAASANVATVQAALEALPSIRSAIVSFSGGASTVCSSAGVVSKVQFTFTQGDLPLLVPAFASLTLSSAGTPNVAVVETTAGTKSNVECSNRGVCNRATGSCQCYNGFLPSDGNGGSGVRADCGNIAVFTWTYSQS
ncbi:hypothetical protein AeNC1_010961 [Aphanomyces euteiches]|nr:hypothetical protein AeNC1_010961 [Aphanomyces euteiches]